LRLLREARRLPVATVATVGSWPAPSVCLHARKLPLDAKGFLVRLALPLRVCRLFVGELLGPALVDCFLLSRPAG
jgi:hypothetical protein